MATATIDSEFALSDDDLAGAISYAKIASNHSSVKLLLLSIPGDRTVGDLADLADSSYACVSMTLKKLREMDLVVARRNGRDGREAFYGLTRRGRNVVKAVKKFADMAK